MRSRFDHALGEVDTEYATVGASVLVGRESGDVFLGIGPRLELGYGWIGAKAPPSGMATADSGGALVLFGSVQAMASASLVECFGWLAVIEAGGVIRGLEGRVDGTAVTGLSGFFAAVLLGLNMVL